MDNIFMILLLLSFVAIFVFAILSLIQVVKKDKIKGMKQLKYTGASIVIFIVSFIGFGMSSDSTTTSNDDNTEKIEVNAEAEKPEAANETEEERIAREQKEAEEKALAEEKAKEEAIAKAKAEEEAKAKAEAKAKEDSIPREYKSALRKAELYAETMHMSKAGIYDQLTSEYGEGFPKEAAQYAIDNIVFDWKEAALKKAQTYAETMAMSDSAIYDQLISEYGEKFTPEDAKYAIENLE